MSADQYRCLTRHFSRGFLENDLIAPGSGLEATLGPLLAAVAVPGILLPVSWLFAYGWPYRSADEFQALVIRHELFLVVIPMFVVAVAAALQWDTLYPDERDAAVLGPLPVPPRTVFLAKASALMLFLGVVALACNGLASICYPLVANIRPQPGSPGLAITFLAHVVATFGAAAFAGFAVMAVPNPVSRASLAFSVKTVVRSARHRLIVAGALGVALAVSLTDLTTKLIRGTAVGAAGPPLAGTLSIQALLMGLLLVGVRLAFSVPAPLQANWVFQLEGPERAAEPRAGARVAAFVLGVAPPIALLAPLHVWQLGWRAAAGHATIGALAGLIFAEVLLTGYASIPFTAAYVPGKARLKSRLVPYLAAFQVGVAALVAVEGWALQQRGRALVVALVLCGVYAGLVLARRRDRSSVVYDEPPPDAIQTLGLEGPADTTARLAGQ